MKRFGLRKINFCFINDVKKVNNFFNQRYFDCYDFFDQSKVLASEKKGNFLIGDCKLNLLCDIEPGHLDDKQVYKMTLDSDIYIDKTDCIQKYIFKEGLSRLNERLFRIYVDSLTEEFGNMLLSDEEICQDVIIGVERNE